MPLTRPVAGTDISAADFGQPVYDGIIRQGFTRTGTDLTATTAVTGVPLATLRESAGSTWAANGANTLFTCPIAGVYSMYASGFGGSAVPPAGTYMGIHIAGIMRARHYLNASVQPYVSFIVTCLALLNVGDTVGFVCGAGSGTHSFGNVPWPGYASDSCAPMLSVWRVGL